MNSILKSSKTKKLFKFDSEYDFEHRKEESNRILSKYPDRIPIIVEPSDNCSITIDKKKYLVPRDLTIGQFIFVVKKRVKLPAEKALFLFVGNTVPSSGQTLNDLYHHHADKDGFLKISFSEENVFG